MYIVRREGNVLTRVCLSVHRQGGEGGYPYPIMLCNITQNAMGQLGWGYPARSSWGGWYPAQGVPCQGGYPARGVTLLGGYPAGGTLPGGYPARGYPVRGVPCQGGYPARGYPVGEGTLQGESQVGYPPGQVRMGGYPVRTTEGVLTTRRAVCLLRSRRRTFLFLSTWALSFQPPYSPMEKERSVSFLLLRFSQSSRSVGVTSDFLNPALLLGSNGKLET